MNLKPLGDKVIIKPLEEEEVTQSGIVLPDTAEKEKPEKGEVIAVGPGKILDNGRHAPISIKTGQKVLFKKYSPDEVKVDGEDFLVVSEEDIVAVIE
ncbi:MAG: co-chaperone GroES [Patescibacteria group bacterium]|nr:co-chaperone GroES [Patescibacteria group bacterium]